MTHLYQVYGTRLWYQDKEVRSFTTPKKTDRNLNFYLGGGEGGMGGKRRTLSAVISFPTLTGSLDPLTGSSDPLEVAIFPTSTVTLLSTVLQFPENVDFLLSAVIVWRVILQFFLFCFFSKRYSFKDFVFIVAFSVSFSFSVLFFLIRSYMQNWFLTSNFDPHEQQNLTSAIIHLLISIVLRFMFFLSM